MHLHVLGVDPDAGRSSGLLVARLSGAAEPATGRRRLLSWAPSAGGSCLALVSYVPLAIHEASNDVVRAPRRDRRSWRAAASRRRSASRPGSPIVGLRVLGWPLTGLHHRRRRSRRCCPRRSSWSSPSGVAGSSGGPDRRGSAERADRRPLARARARLDDRSLWRSARRASRRSSSASRTTTTTRSPTRWCSSSSGWASRPSSGCGTAARTGRAPRPRARPRSSAAAIVVALVGWNLVRQPPAVSPDGGWPGGDAAAERVLEVVGGPARGPVALESLPDVQVGRRGALPARPSRRGSSPDAVRHARAGRPSPATSILCDQLFHERDRRRLRRPGRGRGGRARRSHAAPDRPFEAAPDRWISIYAPAPGDLSASRRERRTRRRARRSVRRRGRRTGWHGARRAAAASATAQANAGAPDAGVRCPRDPDVEGDPGRALDEVGW